MSSYSNLPSYSSGGGSDNAKLMEQMRSQVAVASAQELIQKMSDKCFRKCINAPGSELDSREQKCLSMCMDRYMEAWNITSKSYSSKLQNQRQ
ncbi:mitochondrial import inner membrane translocase subunit Tim13-like [Halichondria panicea]|uniref:mitochondrial import inner membrane translocase subunit Tim13-like n=1 Tax=Halichondria panicea TaxID=6063 RepID=UPI00312BA7C2